MKLGKIEKDNNVRVTWTIREETNFLLEQYKDYYKQEFQSEVPVARLADEILKTFMTDDKGFMNYLKGLKKKLQQEGSESVKPVSASEVKE